MSETKKVPGQVVLGTFFVEKPILKQIFTFSIGSWSH